MLSSIGVRNTVFGTGQLVLDILSAQFRLLTTCFCLDDIRQLDDEVQLSGTVLLVNGIQQVQLSDKPLHRGVRFIHNSIERIFHNTDGALGNENVLFLTALVIIDANFHMLREPFKNLASPHRLNVDATGFLRIKFCIDRDDSNAALVQHRHNDVLHKGSSGLVNIGFHCQTVIKPAVDDLLESVAAIQSHMLNGHR